MVNLFILLILHMIGDFYLQTSRTAICRGTGADAECAACVSRRKILLRVRRIALHALVYVAPFLFLLHTTKWFNVAAIMGVLMLSHAIVDALSCRLNKKWKHILVFILDQGLHIAVLFGVYMLFDFNGIFSRYASVARVIFAVLAITVPSSVFINKVFYDLYPESGYGKIFDVGSVIGMFERILVLIFACFEDFAAIAIIITIKTWARSSDLKDSTEFRNKYLLGTLSSLVLALAVFLIYRL